MVRYLLKARFLVIAALALLSSTAFAENYVAETRFEGAVTGQYTSFTDALDNVSNTDTIYLLQDVTIESLYTLNNGSEKIINMNKFTIFCSDGAWGHGAFAIFHGKMTFCGEGTFRGAGTLTDPDPEALDKDWNGWVSYIMLRGSYERDAENYSVLNIGKDITFDVNGENWNPIGISTCKDDPAEKKTKSFGVVVNFEGKIINLGGWFAFTTNGSINQTTDNVPQINISNAEITSAASTKTGDHAAAVIYPAGYAVWTITNSTIKGAAGIYAKAGTINLINTTIEATGDAHEPTPNGNGCNATGDGIVMDAYEGYAGLMNLNISGSETSITSTNGYAIREVLTKSVSSHVIGVTISNGTFTGKLGAVKYSSDLEQALRDGKSTGKWTVNGIKGGTFSSDPIVCADNFYIKKGETTYGVEEFKGEPEVTNKAYITQYTEVTSLKINENAAVIVKEDGADPVTLKVNGTVTVGEDENTISYITVQPGATLIADNIVTYNNNSLRIESNLTNGSGVVKYDNVSTVDSPKGSVQLAVSARNLDSEHNLWQHFGIPTTGAPTITKNVQTSYVEWNPASGWEFDGGSSRLKAPFVAHGVTVNSDTVGCVITYSGNLVTNNDAKFSLPELGYNFIANSYTAPISAKVLVNSYDDLLSSKATDGAIWVYTPLTRSYVQYNKASFLLGDDVDLPSMQGFFLQNKTEDEQKFTLDYNAAVITKSTSDIKDAAAVAGGKITLSDGAETAKLLIIESDDYSDSFEAGYDAEQMETGNIQIYALSGEYKLASIATNSIDGKIIEIKTKANTAYTLTFSNLQNGGFSLTDISGEQEKEVEIEEGGTYSFTAPASTTVKYFRLGEGTLAAEEADASELNFWVNENTLYVAGAESDIVVYNAAGVKVAAAKADGAAIQAVNIAGLAGGLYIVESGALTGKFIK